MKRYHLVELEDLPWWPRLFRDAATDYLVFVLKKTKAYVGLSERLAKAIVETKSIRIIDMCSGAGGPWPQLLPALRRQGFAGVIILTDLYPNRDALTRVCDGAEGLSSDFDPVDATQVPGGLKGFRTLFTSFHHFRPDQAKAVLTAAIRDGEGILIAEATSRDWKSVLSMLLVPFIVWIVTPAIRPFRWSRLLFTYLVPIIPIAIAWDGIVSCLRTYRVDEMRAMAEATEGESYRWDAGTLRTVDSPLAILFLLGVPRSSRLE